MNEYLIVFRGDYSSMPVASPEEIQASTQNWMNWIGGIAAQNKLADRGNRLKKEGAVLKSDGVVSDGPFAEIKESIMGYSLLKADSLKEAKELVKGCPIFALGGSVEVREISIL